MIGEYYILDEQHQPIKVGLMEWGSWYGEKNRRVDWTRINSEVFVSTVFLGVDINLFGEVPILFETMIFGGAFDKYRLNVSTWNEAVANHKNLVDRLRAGQPLENGM